MAEDVAGHTGALLYHFPRSSGRTPYLKNLVTFSMVSVINALSGCIRKLQVHLGSKQQNHNSQHHTNEFRPAPSRSKHATSLERNCHHVHAPGKKWYHR